METHNPEPKRLTPPQAARILGVGADKIHLWIRSGELVAADLASPGSTRPRYRIHPDDLAAFEKSRTVRPVPQNRRRRQRAAAGITEFY